MSSLADRDRNSVSRYLTDHRFKIHIRRHIMFWQDKKKNKTKNWFQPQLPLRLPCYDLILVIDLTLGPR